MQNAKEAYTESYNRSIHILRRSREVLYDYLEGIPQILDESMTKSDYQSLNAAALGDFLKYDGWYRTLDAVVKLSEHVYSEIEIEEEETLRTGALMIEHISRWAQKALGDMLDEF